MSKSLYRVAVTGHCNLEKCFQMIPPERGNVYEPGCFKKAMDLAREFINRLKHDAPAPPIIHNGMARGWDEIVALAAMEEGVPLLLFVPWSLNWHSHRKPSKGIRAQAIHYSEIVGYKRTLGYYQFTKDLGGVTYPHANATRNVAMVQSAHVTFSFRYRKSGGTDYTISVARRNSSYGGNVPDLKLYEPLPLREKHAAIPRITI